MPVANPLMEVNPLALYKNPKPNYHPPGEVVEKHFHDHDETWVIMDGRAKAYMIDREGQYHEFILEKGDIWMIEAGTEHGCVALEEGVAIFPFPGTIPEGSHPYGHYYMEKEGYLPVLKVEKIPVDRYRADTGRQQRPFER